MTESGIAVLDIEDRFYRPLTADEKRVAAAWIQDAWDELMDVPWLHLPSRLESVEAGLLERVRRVVRASVLRRLQNPQGRRQYSYTVDDATVSETLASETLASEWFTADELAKLAPSGAASDAFTIRVDAGIAPPRFEGHLLPAPVDEWYSWRRVGGRGV